jgi:putative molybdenum carrier protein
VKIISGGQTGVDRAALDVALKYGIECGGWCPAGRLDELGRIPDRYPIKELPGGDFAARTLQNVRDSDATVIFHFGNMRGGTEDTVRCCVQENRPHALINAAKIPANEAAESVTNLVHTNKAEILNVAGPRQSEWAEGYKYASQTLEIVAATITRNAAP